MLAQFVVVIGIVCLRIVDYDNDDDDDDNDNDNDNERTPCANICTAALGPS